MPNNSLTLAVAGSRKTQGIVEACEAAPSGTKILVLTYTSANQLELKTRLQQLVGDRADIEVVGWFSFLINEIVRPYVPYLFRGASVEGFDFNGDPRTYATTESYGRYFNSNGSVLRAHLPQLAHQVEVASNYRGMNRISSLYDRIYIDEVQDLCGYDLEILKLLMELDTELIMVGDVRQAILATNPRERKNKPYMYMEIWKWFKQQERLGKIVISQSNQTFRCRPEIARLADSMFSDEWGFEETESLNSATTSHDGIFLVKTQDIQAYVDEFNPLFLRYSANSARSLQYDFMNIGLSKGLTRQRVLIMPTLDYTKFLKTGKELTSSQASYLYVAVTRAEQSVAFVMDVDGGSGIPFWTPTT